MSVSCLVVGCGYLGLRIAKRWLDLGYEVWATTRTADRAKELGDLGLKPIELDIAGGIEEQRLPVVNRVLFAVGFDRSGPHSQRQVYVEGLRNVLNGLPTTPEQFIYISSTGVYGQTNGEWVDESSATEPAREGGKCCLAAESVVQSHHRGQHSVVLRLAGIYGPNRVPFLAKLRAGEALEVVTEGYLNLIHVDDAADVALSCPIEIESPQVFNVSDGHPVLRRVYYDAIGEHLGVPVRYAEPDPDSARNRRAMGSKRVANRRMLEQLDVHLRFPDYRAGLKQILSSDLRGPSSNG